MGPNAFRPLAYWACQLVGWGLYAGTMLVWVVAKDRFNRNGILDATVPAALGLAVSHLLRAVARRGQWAELALPALGPRVVVASALAGMAMVALEVASLMALGTTSRDELTHLLLGFLVVQRSIIFLLWQVLYFGVHAMRRSRQAELDHLAATAEARTAELRALRSQLNPHFLFNALNTVRALIAEDPAKAQEAVTRLSSLLRYALAAGESQTVALGTELEAVRDYLALEALRFEERLQVRIEVPPACLEAPVPVMLVQGLVENAVKHGIGRSQAGGELALTARREDGQLWVEVRNPSAPAQAPLGDGTGLGLGNARTRLKLLCGEGATLALDTAGPVTTAQVRIPWA